MPYNSWNEDLHRYPKSNQVNLYLHGAFVFFDWRRGADEIAIPRPSRNFHGRIRGRRDIGNARRDHALIFVQKQAGLKPCSPRVLGEKNAAAPLPESPPLHPKNNRSYSFIAL